MVKTTNVKTKNKQQTQQTQQTQTDRMAQKIATSLRESYVRDLQKPELDYFERAAIISHVLEDKGWSIREMARQLIIPKSTIEDWLLFSRISEEEYDALRAEGISHTQIYRELRDRKGQKNPRINLPELDMLLKGQLNSLKSCNKEFNYSEKTRDLLSKVHNELNRIESDINIAEKKKRVMIDD